VIDKKSFFIVLEGIDGAGKSTQAKLLKDFFLEKNFKVKLFAEPSTGKWGREIRTLLAGDKIPSIEKQLELFLLDREDDVQKNILPSINKEESVILDRYFYSNAAYQGAMGFPYDDILKMNNKKNFPKPDFIFYIDLLPEKALNRINLREGDKRDIFEKKDFLIKVRNIYLEIEEKADNFFILDGSLSEEKIQKNIQDVLKKEYKFSENE